MPNAAEQLEIIRRGTLDIIPEEELSAKLQKGRPLNIKFGADPSAPDIHLGHVVVLRKLRDFQRLGHKIVFLIGDFTGMIGDPTGKSETRKQLSKEEVLRNAKTYQEQIGKILDINKMEIRFNSEWLSKMNFEDVIRLASKYTVARILERDDFAKRFAGNLPISIHEFFYPLMQGYDSVALKTDIEIGGKDQTFNLLVGRELQREYGVEPQVILTMPLLEGLDGVQKMSKSLGNYIGINEPPDKIFGKIMSISDELMLKYFKLLTELPLQEIERMPEDFKSGARHPRSEKKRLARLIITDLHSESVAQAADEEFENVFKKNELPEDIPDFNSPRSQKLCVILKDSGLVPSNSEGKRQIVQGGVRINGQKVADPEIEVSFNNGDIIQIGKRKFVRIKVKE
ncbi:MAG: tyrosine--tRNA ligase [Candidatus Wallbacteria bacterium]|nr:tyrosine--tRNA ligase [Candidatus Wallbacteria bacterium]